MDRPAPETGLVARIDRGAVHDGPGLRTVVFLKGCPLRCLWCHSPETQTTRPELLLLRERCLGCGACVAVCPSGAAGLDAEDLCRLDRTRCRGRGACADACPTGARQLSGRACSVDEIMVEVLRDRIFFDQSGGGLTLSGGEPLLQQRFALALLERCRKERVHTAVETCGLVVPRVLLAAAARTDLFLFDLKIIDDRRHRMLTGSSNARVLANLNALVTAHTNVVVRYPLVPGLNDDRAAVEGLGAFAAGLGIQRIDVLPYHRAGIAKYERLDRSYSLAHVEPPDATRVAHTVATLRSYGIDVTAGGVR
jgi:pyruvate formate lyase activating enzyme